MVVCVAPPDPDPNWNGNAIYADTLKSPNLRNVEPCNVGKQDPFPPHAGPLEIWQIGNELWNPAALGFEIAELWDAGPT